MEKRDVIHKIKGTLCIPLPYGRIKLRPWVNTQKILQSLDVWFLGDCPVLSVCEIGVLWPIAWIKVPLGMEVGLGPSHTVLDAIPAPQPPKGAQPLIFGPCLLWLNGWMDQATTW